MKILLSERSALVSDFPKRDEVCLLVKKKMDTDEKIVRDELVRVWIKILNKYGAPGAYIPPVEEVRRELLKVGVDAAVDAVTDEYLFVFSWMIRDEVEEKVKRGLNNFDLGELVADVRRAQNDPALLAHLREEIRHYVLFEDF